MLIQKVPDLTKGAVLQINFRDLCERSRPQLVGEGLKDASGQVGALQEGHQFPAVRRIDVLSGRGAWGT